MFLFFKEAPILISKLDAFKFLHTREIFSNFFKIFRFKWAFQEHEEHKPIEIHDFSLLLLATIMLPKGDGRNIQGLNILCDKFLELIAKGHHPYSEGNDYV